MGGFSVYAAMGEGFKAAIQGLEARIEDIAQEMQRQAEEDAATSAAESVAQENYNTAFEKANGNESAQSVKNAQTALEAAKQDAANSGGESVTLLSIDMQRFIQEWSFLLTNATNAMKTYGDGLMSLARNL